MLGQQRIEIVPRHPARDVRIALPDLVSLAVAQPAQPPVDFRAPVPRRSIAVYSSSLVGPHQNRVPSYSSTLSAAMLSTTLPVRYAVARHELFPTIPPSMQFMWVAGSRRKRRPCGASFSFS
jgi:hypothetical protein